MRSYERGDLPDDVARYLMQKQAEVDSGKDARATWKNARETKTMARVVEALKRMTGARARCMYCEDSRGSDMDHFYPLARYGDKAFFWLNLLWNCTDCGRHKGDRFPVDAAGAPLLIDPTTEDPWDFLFYDTATGNLAPRFDPSTGLAMPKGESTLAVLEPLLDEAVVEGRRRTQRNLFKAVRAFLNVSDQPESIRDLFESVHDNEAYGLAHWYVNRDGRTESPFAELRALHPDVWRRIEATLVTIRGARPIA